MTRLQRLIAIALLALVLAGCGTEPRTTNYHDYESGISVNITCDFSKFENSLDHDTCAIIILDDGS